MPKPLPHASSVVGPTDSVVLITVLICQTCRSKLLSSKKTPSTKILLQVGFADATLGRLQRQPAQQCVFGELLRLSQ